MMQVNTKMNYSATHALHSQFCCLLCFTPKILSWRYS